MAMAMALAMALAMVVVMAMDMTMAVHARVCSIAINVAKFYTDMPQEDDGLKVCHVYLTWLEIKRRATHRRAGDQDHR